MKNITFFFFLFLMGSIAYSQVGIGTDSPNPSTQLEIVAADRGVLIPQVTLTSTTDATTIVAGNINSLLVFNTAEIADVTPGYYYWYIDSWKRIVPRDEVVNGVELPDNIVIYDVDNSQFTHVDENGNTQVIDFKALIQASEIQTLLVDNTDGTYTYYNKSEIDENGDPLPGTGVTVDIPASVMNQFEDIVNNGPVTVDGNSYNTIEEYIEDIVADNETQTLLVDNTDGTYTYYNESEIDENGAPLSGTGITVDIPTSVMNQFEDIVNNGPVTIDGNTYNSIEEYIESIVADNETQTLLVDNTDGTYTYYNETGIDANGDPIPGTGVNVDIPASVVNQFEDIVNNGPVTIAGNTYNSIEEYIESIVADNETQTLLVDNTDGTYTYYNETGIDANGDPIPGTGVNVDIPASVMNQFEDIVNNGPVTVDGNTYNTIEEYIEDIVADNETQTLLVDNTDGTYTYYNESEIDENGDPLPGTGVTVDIPTSVMNQFEDIVNNGPVTVDGNTYNTIEEYIEDIVADNETQTLLVDNTDGTYTYYNESEIDENGDPLPGTGVTVDIPTSVMNQFEDIVNNGPVTVDGNTYNTIEEYIEDIVADNETQTLLVDNTDGTYTYYNESEIDENGAPLPGTGVTVDIPTSVMNQFEDIVNNGPVTVDGNTYNTIEEYIDNVAAATASNGLYIDNTTGDVKLGGTLSEPTEITTTATETMAIAGLEEEMDITLVDITVVDKTTGVLKTLPVEELAIEPWFNQDTDSEATDNTQNIYQMGNIAIGKTDNLTGTALDVEGAVRVGTGHSGTVGVNSVAFGEDNIASAQATVAIGASNNVTGLYGQAYGFQNTVSASSIVMGQDNTVPAANSFVAGIGNQADGENSYILGDGNTVTSNANFNTVVLGEGNIMDNSGYILGNLNEITGPAMNSVILGYQNTSANDLETVLGHYNAITTNIISPTESPLLQVGNGANSGARTNALTILNNGYIGTDLAIAPTERLDIGSGNVRVRDIFTSEGDSGEDRVVVADVDGVLSSVDVDALSTNIYNSDGLLTGAGTNRDLDLNGKTLNFIGADRRTYWDAAGRIHQTATNTSSDAAMGFHNGGSNLWIQQWNTSTSSIMASGSSTALLLSTHATDNSAPIRFSTSTGSGTLAAERMRITGEGEIVFAEYPSTRDNSGTTPVENILYTDVNGNMLSAPAASIVTEPWLNQADDSQATTNTQDIYQIGKVGIGTNDMLGTTNPDVQLAVNGSILTTTSIYADYVFEDYFKGSSELNKDYAFKSLKEVEEFIIQNRHLPGITKITALAKSENGHFVFNASQLSIQLLEKVEELYLHMIEQRKLVKGQENRIGKQQALLEEKNNEINELKASQVKLEQRLQKVEGLLLKME